MKNLNVALNIFSTTFTTIFTLSRKSIILITQPKQNGCIPIRYATILIIAFI